MKKLIDILELIDESSNVYIYDEFGKELAKYDGKDSIPNELNDREVDEIGNDWYYKNPYGDYGLSSNIKTYIWITVKS